MHLKSICTSSSYERLALLVRGTYVVPPVTTAVLRFFRQYSQFAAKMIEIEIETGLKLMSVFLAANRPIWATCFSPLLELMSNMYSVQVGVALERTRSRDGLKTSSMGLREDCAQYVLFK